MTSLERSKKATMTRISQESKGWTKRKLLSKDWASLRIWVTVIEPWWGRNSFDSFDLPTC